MEIQIKYFPWVSNFNVNFKFKTMQRQNVQRKEQNFQIFET